MSVQAMAIHAAGEKLPTGLIMMARFGLPLFLNLTFAFLFKKVRKELRFHNVKLLTFRSISAAIAMSLVFLAIPGNNAGIVYLVFFSQPIFIPFLLRIWLKIPLHAPLFVGIILSIVGLSLVLKPGEDAVSWTLFLVPIATLAASFSSVSLRQLHYSDTTLAITTFYCGIGTCLGAILALFDSATTLSPLTAQAIAALFVIGITGFIFQFLITEGMKYGPSRLLSPFLYASSLFSLFLDYLFFAESVTLINLLGVALVIGGVVLNIFLFPKDKITKIGSVNE